MFWIQPAGGSGALDLFLHERLVCRRTVYVFGGPAVAASLLFDYRTIIKHMF